MHPVLADRNGFLTPGQMLREDVMRSVIQHVQDAPCILRGGSALAFTRGLNRHTTDLDFDLEKKANLEPLIRTGVEAAGMRMPGTERRPHRKSARYWVDYQVTHGEKPVQLKVDAHFLDKRFTTDIQVVAGIRTYTVGALFEQKLAATGSRNEANDLFDLAFMVTRLADSLNDRQILRLQQFIGDPRRLDRRYRQLFHEEEALRRITTYNGCKRDIERAVASEIARRGIEQPQQRILISEPIFQKILAYHRRRLGESPGDHRAGRDRSRTDDWEQVLSR